MKTCTCLLILGLSSILLASCAPRHPKDMRQIDELRTNAEGLVKAQALMGFESWAHGASSNQDSLYQAHAGLFTPDNINLARRAMEDETDAIQKKRLAYFLRYLTLEYVSKETAALNDQVANTESQAMVTIDGDRVPYRRLPLLLANETNAARRQAIYAAADPVLDTLNLLFARIEERSRKLAQELDYPSYTAMVEAVKGFSIEDAGRTAERVLADTDSLYHALLREQLAGQLHVSPDQFQPSDVAALIRNARFDKYFPGDRLIPTLTAVYRDLGVDIATQKNLLIDAEDRPSKNPRAVCFPVNVPNDIRLSIKPIGGADDYAALFHEAGHAEHYANTKEHAFEFCYAGEPTVTESFAFLSEYMLQNQAWLRMRSGIPTVVAKQYLRFSAFHRLWYVRRYCAKLLYEMQLHAGAGDPAALYGQLLSRAVGYADGPSLRKHSLADVDAFFYSAGYLRAWYLESQINARLSNDFGANWFEHPGAGGLIRSLWANGDRLDGKELAQTIGEQDISPDAWINEMRAITLFSTP